MAALSRQDAIIYLANNPNFEPTKPLEEYSTAQLRRYAQIYFLAEQAGKTITQKRARGHATAPIQYVPADPSQHIIERHQMNILPGEDYMSVGDLKNLLRKGKRTLPRLFIVTGVVEYNGITSVQTLGFYITKEQDLTTWLKANPNNLVDIAKFASDFMNLGWQSVEEISLAYPVNPKPKE